MYEIFKLIRIYILKYLLWMGELGNFIIMIFIYILVFVISGDVIDRCFILILSIW